MSAFDDGVTAPSSEHGQSSDESVTRTETREERDKRIAEETYTILRDRHSEAGRRGNRAIQELRAAGRKGAVPKWARVNSTPESIANLLEQITQDAADTTIRQRMRERVRLMLNVPDHEHDLMMQLHALLEKEREVPLDELNERARRLVQTKGAHWRTFWCAGCERRFVSYHAPRSNACRSCQGQLEKRNDAFRKVNARRAARVAKGLAPPPMKCACGEELPYMGRPDRKFCSAACRQTAYRIRATGGAS